MGATKFIKGAFTFFMLMMTVAINTDKNAITRLGFEPNYLAALVVIILSPLIERIIA